MARLLNRIVTRMVVLAAATTIITMLLGIAGALVGGFLGRAMGFYGPSQGAGWIMSVIGAVILLALYRMMMRRQA